MKKRSLFPEILIFFCLLFLSLRLGRYPVPRKEFFHYIIGGAVQEQTVRILLDVRLPRLIFAAVSGMALALAGWVYQNIFQNTLVSPDVLGVNGGCSVGAVLAILLGAPLPLIAASSAVFGLGAVGLTFLLARRFRAADQNVTLLLCGMAVGALAGSVLMLLKYLADPMRELAVIDYWLMGSFHTITWKKTFLLLAAALPGLGLSLMAASPIRLLSLGAEEARSLGVPVRKLTVLALLMATIPAAAAVAFAGSVSWLGLLVPHLTRLYRGEKRSTPFAVLLNGASLLLLADLLARGLSTSEIPVSIFTSAMGAVFLLCLLFWGMPGKRGKRTKA